MARDKANRGNSFVALSRLSFAMVALAIVPASAQAPYTETVLKSFASSAPNGVDPLAGIVLDAAGNIYGTATEGGAGSGGVVYKVDAAGKETVLYSFSGGADGKDPQGGVILDSAGNLYGTTTFGGAANWGVVYKLDPAGNETVLHSFAAVEGVLPMSGLIRDAAGNLYGTTYNGGPAGQGVVFKLDPSGHQTVLYAFTGGADGGYPSSGVVRDDAGNLYGTTAIGGPPLPPACNSGCGVVYKLDTSGLETVLHAFAGGADGVGSAGGVILDAEGYLYGTTARGGTGTCEQGCGTVFRVDAAGKETILYTFMGGNDGRNPQAGLTMGASGTLYGTAEGGVSGRGLVFSMDAAGLHVLHAFANGRDGNSPKATLTLDAEGNLYGTTEWGGMSGAGAVYKLDTSGQETIFNCFEGGRQGNDPLGGLLRDAAGNLYGTTFYGGLTNQGLVYKIYAAGGEKVLYNFTGGANVSNPLGDLIADADGNLYGIGSLTASGGLYKIARTGQETLLYTFPNSIEPDPGIARDAAGNLYGATARGGENRCNGNGCGVVYKLDPVGQLTTLYRFTGGADGGNPSGGVVRDAEGNLYGTTTFGGATNWGVVYKVDPAGSETVLYAFAGGTDGGAPSQGVIRDAAGNLFGTTSLGGATGGGVVFELDPAGHESVLYTSAPPLEYDTNYSSLTLDAGGNLYGTTLGGGTAGCGAVYQIAPAGQYTVLYSFTCGSGEGSGGHEPQGPVILDSEGNIYGVAAYGGSHNGGTVFKLSPSGDAAGVPPATTGSKP